MLYNTRMAKPHYNHCEILTAPQDYRPLPNLSAAVRHDGKYNRPDSRFSSDPLLRVTDDLSSIAYAVPERDLARGGSSRHGAFVAHVRYAEQKRDMPETLVVKPSTVPTALGELAMTQYLEREGLAPFSVDGLVVDGAPEGAAAQDRSRVALLLSRYQPEVVGFDSLAWHEMSMDDVALYATEAATALAALHRVAVAHGDGYLRNVVRVSGQPARMIDFEHAVSFSDVVDRADGGDEAAQHHIADMMSRDLCGIVADVAQQVQLTRSTWLDPALNAYYEQLAVRGHDQLVTAASTVMTAARRTVAYLAHLS